ncbi:MAG TPA: polysaccharide biosynthesis protein, partial [Mangrovimonas sp.]|nr:polysaccharide biosynthesis protein [Mangrovimonas sp.]
ISLSGLHYPEDIDIKIVGLRPGEKIYEELLTKDENIKPTYHEKIMIAKTRDLVDDVELKIIELCKITPNAQNIYIVSKIKELVPEYTPNNSKYDVIN